MTMEEIIESCNKALDEVTMNQGIPDWVWKTCKGVAIIAVSETGFLLYAVSEGKGVIIKKNDDGTWGVPSAIKFSGKAVGAVFGKASKQIYLFPMTEGALKMLAVQKTETKKGAQMGMAVGPFGGETLGNLGEKGEDITYSYTFEKGAFLDIGYNDYQIEADDAGNADFYGKAAVATDIIMTPDTVQVPTGKGVEEMREKLASLSNV